MTVPLLSALLLSLDASGADHVSSGAEAVPVPVKMAPAPRTAGRYRMDRDFRIVEIDDVALAHLNLSREAAEGAVLWDLAPGLIGTVCETHYRDALKGFACEFIGPSAVRPGRWLKAKITPVGDTIDVVIRDITAHRAKDA